MFFKCNFTIISPGVSKIFLSFFLFKAEKLRYRLCLVSFNKGIKVKFGLPSVNKSWLSTYHMQNSSCPRNTKLITYNPLEDFLKKFYQCFPEVSTSFSKFLTQWFPRGILRKYRYPDPTQSYS